MAAAYSFGCTACGKCCTSSPLLSLPELFRHQARFVGLLGVRRLGGHIDGISSGGLFAFTCALDHAGAGRCPALTAQGLCSLHGEGKPVACRVVPFDALLPDEYQASVLEERRRDAERWDARCLAGGAKEAPLPDGHAVVYRRLRIVDPGIARDIEQHRRALRDDYRFWGEVVVAEIAKALDGRPKAAPTLDEGGIVTLPLAPVLLVLAATSDAVRRRCLEFVESQRALLDTLRSTPDASPAFISETRTLSAANDAVARMLAGTRAPSRSPPESERVALERWLDLQIAPPRAVANS